MNENEKLENQTIKFHMVDLFLGYMFIIFNICIIFVLFSKIKNRDKKIKKLKTKFYFLIIFDIISTLLYINIEVFLNSPISDILFGCLSLIAFYLFFSLIYEIFNCTKIHVLAKRPKIINKMFLAIFLVLLSLSLYKIKENKILNILQLIFVFICLIILYIYFNYSIKSISKHLIAGDFQSKKIYSYLYMINIYCIFLLFCYNFTKLILIFINPDYILYAELALSIFNYGIKYYVFSLLTLIIFTFNKKSYKKYNDEIITIINQGVFSN